MNSIAHLSSKQLHQAASLKEKIAGLQKQLAVILGGNGAGMPSPFKTAKPVKKRGMSAEGRAKVAAAQKLRWSKIKAAKAKPAAQPVKKARKKLSAAAKAILSAKLKAIWAARKAAKK
jgi:hypothetical protein